MSSVDELLDLTPAHKSEWNDSEYAVYVYTPNRARERNEGKTAGAGFSLSLVGTSISPDREHLLRGQVATKMSQGSLYAGNGQVTTLDPDLFPPPSQSYYCLLDVVHGSGRGGRDRHSSTSSTSSREEGEKYTSTSSTREGKERHVSTSSTGSRGGGRERHASTSSTGSRGGGRERHVRQFLVCFVAIGKQGLDLFRNELDSYSQLLVPLLHKLPKDEPTTAFPGSKIENKIKNWFSENVAYLTRVVHLCHFQLSSLLHTAVNSTVEVSGDKKEAVKDVRRFMEACSLATLMQGDTKKDDTAADLVGGALEETPVMKPVHIHVTKDGCTISPEETSKFCSNWAEVLLSQGMSSPDPFFLRQAVENYKLKIIQDINALKRLLRQAETDYHALYRCYVFLCACGNGRLLLQCAMQEAKSLPSPETLSVLKALKIYTDKCGFKNMRTN